jgi:hypothetical protein
MQLLLLLLLMQQSWGAYEVLEGLGDVLRDLHVGRVFGYSCRCLGVVLGGRRRRRVGNKGYASHLTRARPEAWLNVDFYVCLRYICSVMYQVARPAMPSRPRESPN